MIIPYHFVLVGVGVVMMGERSGSWLDCGGDCDQMGGLL